MINMSKKNKYILHNILHTIHHTKPVYIDKAEQLVVFKLEQFRYDSEIFYNVNIEISRNNNKVKLLVTHKNEKDKIYHNLYRIIKIFDIELDRLENAEYINQILEYLK